jgi:ubiquinone/menaquinone biosynthesis C-methylase UbiE
MITWQPDNVFSGTAWYYARFRPDYPEEVINLLLTKFGLSKDSRILDLGCGTGQISIPIAPYVSEIIAIDPQQDMINEGKSIASTSGITNIKWVLGESAQLPHLMNNNDKVNLTVIARAFHWMDREQTLKDLYHLTQSGGGVAIITDNGPRDAIADTKWKLALDDVVHHWLGDIRLAGTKGTYSHPVRRHEEIVRESEFRNLESITINTRRTWNIDQLIGYLYSTSSSSIPVLGDKKEPFESDVRHRLLTINPDGLFEEKVTTSVLIVWKN